MLQEQIKKEMTESLKSGDQLKRLVLGTLLTAVKNRELTKRTQLSKTVTDTAELEKQSRLNDEEVLEVVSGEVKKRKDSIEQFKAGGRIDLAEKEEAEAKILKAYLPEQLNEEEIKEEIKKAITELNAGGLKEMGKVIALVMSKLKGRADGSSVSRITKELLG
ncbi:MAG: GatB/YqeY domain-containing protein [Candidatus Yanofskybacteria bacterium]|nr:GatB/YqeY domain-containing protein [Candidatus Yanofskybacteria bacterium]